ncbi:MAG: ATP-binding cassette domain-containing protein [Actinobacteria bacterium]|nr:ATP-binding cassette domain-containing protein [Actinomycetota bacterium]
MTDVRVEGLTVEFATPDYVVKPVDGFDLDARSGEMVLLLGPSGSGKTTILSCLAGILSPNAGRIRVGDAEVTELSGDALATYRRDRVGIVFQAFNLLPSLTAVENVEAGLRLAGRSRAESRERATALLTRFGLADRMGNRPGQMSGGQQQRVAIARALAHDPKLVLADEPTASLDYIQAESVINAIRELAAPGRLVIIATHDERMIPLADQVIELTANFRDLSLPPQHVELGASEFLFRQGDPPERIYLVEAGEIEILKELPGGRHEVVAVRGPGRYFGEIGPLFGLPRTAAARAQGPARVTGYTVRDFRKLFGDDPKLAKLLSHAVSIDGAPAAADPGGPPESVSQAARELGRAVVRWWRAS